VHSPHVPVTPHHEHLDPSLMISDVKFQYVS